MKKDAEEPSISLHFDGSLVKDNEYITARTLGHSLESLQRVVDKSVLYEKRGNIKKRDVLPSIWYPQADLIVKPFKKGCVTVPLSGLQHTNVIGMLKGVLYAPYEEAISETEIESSSLMDSLPTAFNRAVYKIGMLTHEELILDSSAREQRYFAEGVLRDFDMLISPLRSGAATDKDLISIELRDANGTKEFEFDKYTSQRFHKIVSQKQLGPIVQYTGRLVEFGETKSRAFPYSGRFFSEASKQEHKLLITKEGDSERLRRYNTSKKLKLNFLGAPIMAWGAFDERKGDLVFLKLLEDDE